MTAHTTRTHMATRLSLSLIRDAIASILLTGAVEDELDAIDQLSDALHVVRDDVTGNTEDAP